MKTFILDPISEDALAYARTRLDVVAWNEENIFHAEEAEAVIVRTYRMDRTNIDRMPKLRIIAKHGVGVDNIDIPYACSKGICVTNTPTANSNSVAELIIGLILDCAHKITASHLACMKGLERNQPMFLSGYEITGKRLGLIGLGNIGRIAGRRLKAGFDMDVLGYDPFVTKEQCNAAGFAFAETPDEIYRSCDIISVSVPLTEGTRDMIGRDALAKMKPSSILINAARGGVVDEVALVEALKENRIFGAAVDAFVEEPVPKNHRLFSCGNFVGTPHNGANTTDALTRMGTEAVDEIVRFERGEATRTRLGT